MKRFFLCFLVLWVIDVAAQAPNNETISRNPKGVLYFGVGGHRSQFSKSTIHFRDNKTGDYDFKLVRAKAVDDPVLSFAQGVTAPQYSVRVGYYFNNTAQTGLEFSFDHIKYMLQQGQKVRLKGTINRVFYDTDTTLSRNFIEYEHTDGANFYMINFLKRFPLLKTKEKHQLDFTVKPGVGIGIPRSDTRILGKGRNDRYNLAGIVAGLESGVRYEFFRNFFIEGSLKGSYAHFSNVLLYGKGRARHSWFTFQYVVIAGVQFPTKKSR